MAEQKKGLLERAAGFFERVHYALGAAALVGALVALAEIVTPLVIFGVYEFAHGALWNWLKKHAPGSKSGQARAVPA